MSRITVAELIRELERDLSLAPHEIAQALGVHPRTVDRWLEGDIPQRNEGRQRLDGLEDLRNRIYRTFSSREAAQAWIQRDNRYLGNIPPAEFLRTGRVDRVNAALEALDSGYFV
jgi:hypothetical protein